MNSMLESTDFAIREVARKAAVESAGATAVGVFIDTKVEEELITSYNFQCKLKGYPDWHWSVVVFNDGVSEPTVSEVLLLPTEASLQAPAWVPWSERLADYQALQAELEAVAAEAAEAAEETEPDADDAEDNFVDIDEEDSALSTDVDEPVNSKNDSDSAGRKLPGFNLLKLLRGKKKK